MKKIFIFILLAIALSGITVSAKDIDVVLNGEKLQFEVPPIIENNRTLVPFRKIFETLGYEVYWNGEDKSILAQKPDTTMRLQIDNTTMLVNNATANSDITPKLINSTTYVPIRIISEYSGCDVLWSPEEQAVLLYSKQQAYKPCIQGTYSVTATDGNYIYTHDDKATYRFKEDLTREDLSFGIGNEIAVVDNKLYTRGLSGNLHYQCIDLNTHEISDLTETDVANCLIADNKIYYGFAPDPRNENPDKHGIYTMNLDGTDKKQIYTSNLYGYFVKDDLIFSENKIISLKDGSEKKITDKFITASTLDEENYYIAVNEYTDEKNPLKPIGIIAYNYNTNEEKLFPFDKEIRSIQVTGNSIFITYEIDNTDYKNFNNCSLVRLTKNFEYPVLLKDNIYGDIYVYGNYVYFYDRHKSESNSGFSRISADGKDFINLESYWNPEPDSNKKINISYSYPYNDSEKSKAFISMLEKRLLDLGCLDAVITETSNNNCIVQLYNIGDNEPQKFAETLAAVGVMILEDADGVVLLTNEDISSVTAQKKEMSNMGAETNYIELKLTADGQKKFASATEYIAAKVSEGKNYISIRIDNSVISSPRVVEKIDSDTVIITGNFTEKSAKEFALLLNSGIMPFKATVADVTVEG